MRRRFSFTIAFAVLVVAQVAVVAYWSSLRPPPSVLRQSIDGMVVELRNWADKLESVAAEVEPDNPKYAALLRKHAASDRKLADRIDADPADGVAVVITAYMQSHQMRRTALLRDRIR